VLELMSVDAKILFNGINGSFGGISRKMKQIL